MSTDPALGSFAERLLAAVDRGRRTGTHKLVLLLALVDEVPERFDPRTGAAPHSIHLEDLAHRVLDYTLLQSRPFRDGHAPLGQLRSTRQSSLVTAGQIAREEVGVYDAGLRDADDLRVRDPRAYRRAIVGTVNTLVRNPLPRLQGEGASEHPFLYHWPWSYDSSPASVREAQGGKLEVSFVPGAPEELVRLAALVRPLVELHYLRDVARWNGLGTVETELAEYLFGSERASISRLVRRQLRRRQGGRCFYGDEHGDPEGPSRTSLVVDHFMPWSRFRSDVAENLVLATASRNSSKSDHLPHPRHVVRFLHQLRPVEGELVANSRDGLARTQAMIASAYRTAPLGTPMWLRTARDGPALLPYDGDGRRVVFEALRSSPGAS